MLVVKVSYNIAYFYNQLNYIPTLYHADDSIIKHVVQDTANLVPRPLAWCCHLVNAVSYDPIVIVSLV